MLVMSGLNKDLVFLILQFLEEEKYEEALHKLEKDSGFFFNMKYFENEVLKGNWDEVESYLFGFTKIEDNRYSMKTFFEIRKQKYFEALDKRDRPKAVDILVKDLKDFAAFNEEIFKEMTQLITLENFRDNKQLSKYGDTKSARSIMLIELKKLIGANPLLRDKLQFPEFKSSRLQKLINLSLNWQHQHCKNPSLQPDIKSLIVDHSCEQQDCLPAPSPANNLLLGGPVPRSGLHRPLGAHVPIQPTPGLVPTSFSSWISNPLTGSHPMVSGGQINLGGPQMRAALKHPRSPTNPVNFPPADLEYMRKRARQMGITDEVNLPVNTLPKTVSRTLNQGSAPTSMDFHPMWQTILLVGTNVGDIGLWEVGTEERLVHRNFKVWNVGKCSMNLQVSLMKDPNISVNRVIWSRDGSLFGVAYSRHLLQIYSYSGNKDIHQLLEIDAHVGGVNDLAFSNSDQKLSVITCGDDKLIKVWDVATGTKMHNFEGHEAPVISVCPHHKNNTQFIFSTGLDGKIKAWLYDNLGARMSYDSPGRWLTTMAYSADGTRLFSCGTSKEGESNFVEWDEDEGLVKREYQGLRKPSLGIVQFDTAKNRLLAAGDDYRIKFWHMDNTEVLTSSDADGGLIASPRIRFNRDGNLLAVTSEENRIKILANTDGLRLLHTSENVARVASRAPEASKPNINTLSTTAPISAGLEMAGSAVGISAVNGNSRSFGETNDKPNTWKLSEINEPSQCRCLKLPDNSKVAKISRLMYTSSGNAILALASNATHFLWKWQRNDSNPSGKASVTIPPLLWKPPIGVLMTNDTTGVDSDESTSCFALSKNDSYLTSASGGKTSLFNLVTFKVMTTFISPPPAATFLAFLPHDNNNIAIGMDDSTIHIFNVKSDEVISCLRGHSKRITSLAFSQEKDVLVSSAADAQLCVWSIDTWEKRSSRFLQIPSGYFLGTHSETHVQFHQDQIHFLAVHETHLAIYETTKLECVKQWTPREYFANISHATFSCDSQLVYASFVDGMVGVFTAADLKLRCRINPCVYIPSSVISNVARPIVVAANPQEARQFALGLSDGCVVVFEPLESEGKWFEPLPAENAPAVGGSSSGQR